VCHAWAREREWLRIGGVVAGSLLRSLNLNTVGFGELSTAVIPGSGGLGGLGRATVPGISAAMQRAARLAREEAEADSNDDDDSDPDLDSDLDSDSDFGRRGFAALPEPQVTRRPEDIGAVVGALIHLHVLKVLEFDARISIGLGARDWAVQTFLALPLLLPALERTLGRPFDLPGHAGHAGHLGHGPGEGPRSSGSTGALFEGGAGVVDEGFARRWNEYGEHLAGLVP